MLSWTLQIHAFATLAMVGLIWFVQVVHYPLMGRVGRSEFVEYERLHQQRTTWVVAPLMLTESAAAALLITWLPAGRAWLGWIGAALLAGVWASTFFWQVPLHARLGETFDAATHRRLVRSNWLRTGLWTMRGVLACALLA